MAPDSQVSAPQEQQKQSRWPALDGFFAWLKDPSHIISMIAFVLSISTLALNEYRRAKDNQFAIISRAYDRYYEMNKIQIDKWYLAHLFTTPDQYEKVKSTIRDGLKDAGTRTKSEYLLQERATADFIFLFYEQTRAQWASTQDSERRYIQEVLLYLNGRMLHNPRLVYWWLKDGSAGLQSSYDAELKADWNKNVAAKLKKDAGTWCDPVGPFDLALGAGTAPSKAACE